MGNVRIVSLRRWKGGTGSPDSRIGYSDSSLKIRWQGYGPSGPPASRAAKDLKKVAACNRPRTHNFLQRGTKVYKRELDYILYKHPAVEFVAAIVISDP